MEIQGIFGSERQFELKQAILIYAENKPNGNPEFGATVHTIGQKNGAPLIGPGSPITLTAVESLAAALGRRLPDCLLPERILSVSMSQMAWWCPAARRRIWFNPAENTKERAALKKLNGKFVQHPALLFLVSPRNFRVFALAADRRPDARTVVYRAPYFNISEDGRMCEGNVRLPDVISPDAYLDYERAFFNSAFSHTNWGHRLTRHPGGHLGLWQAMATRRQRFPTEYLLPLKTKLTTLIKGDK